jgi:hypothetical protein
MKRNRDSQESNHPPLDVNQIVQGLQKGCESGIYYAYFGRDQEFTYHFVPTLNDLIENIPEFWDEPIVTNDLYDCEQYQHATGLRCDEYLVFPTHQILEDFRAEIARREPMTNPAFGITSSVPVPEHEFEQQLQKQSVSREKFFATLSGAEACDIEQVSGEED